jgi:hypothetical protein
MRRSGGQPTRLTRLAGTALAIVAVTVLLGAAPAGPTAVAPVLLIDAPSQGAGSTGGLLGGLGWILILGLAIAAVALILAAVVLFRTRGSKAAPPSEGWWTCANCGAGNMDGSARCHACATWRSTTARPTPTT